MKVLILILLFLMASSAPVLAHSVVAQTHYTQALTDAKKNLLFEKQQAKRTFASVRKVAKGKQAAKKIKEAKKVYNKRLAKAQKAYDKAAQKAGERYTVIENEEHAKELVSSRLPTPVMTTTTQKSEPIIEEPSIQSTRVTYTRGGFSPRTVSVKKGAVVLFANESDETLWVGSDPHPSHEWLSGFDSLAGFQKGESYSYTFSKEGTWGYHNHVNPVRDGFVEVKP